MRSTSQTQQRSLCSTPATAVALAASLLTSPAWAQATVDGDATVDGEAAVDLSTTIDAPGASQTRSALPASPPDQPPAATPETTEADAALLSALISLERSLYETSSEGQRATVAAIHRIVALEDARAVPTLIRMSRAPFADVRVAALQALAQFVDDEAAQKRLWFAVAQRQNPQEAAVAMQGLMEAARRDPAPEPRPCPEGFDCVSDAELLAAWVAYDRAAAKDKPALLEGLGALRDPRALHLIWRLSYVRNDEIRRAALGGLARQGQLDKVRERLLEVLREDYPDDVLAVLPGLEAAPDEETTTRLTLARRSTAHASVRAELDRILGERAPEALAAIEAEEAEAARRAALVEEPPDEFDWLSRAAVSAAAGMAGAYGGAAASYLAADAIAPDQAACYGCYGCGVGAGSAAALSWFSLGDQQLSYHDTALALSGSLWGAWAGLLTPWVIAGDDIGDYWAHSIYAAGVGHLLGLSLGTVGGLLTDFSTSDLVELNLSVLSTNALALGVLLSLSPIEEQRVFPAALVGATLVGAAAGEGVRRAVELDGEDLGHVVVGSLLGGGTGLMSGLALQQAIDNPDRVLGLTLIGGVTGVASAIALSPFDLNPSVTGLVYESWAGISGGALGLGMGLLVDALAYPSPGPPPPNIWPYALGAAGIAAGAGTTALFPDGVDQDVGDLLLQPLLVPFALYHSSVLLGVSNIEPRLVLSSALIAPALTSAALVHTAPYVDAAAGDVLMVAASMAWGAWFSALGTGSVSLRDPFLVDPTVWVLVTALGMDAGLLGGVGLNFLDVDHLGWKFTYVTAVAAAMSLGLALPASLIAVNSGGLVQITDILLATSLIGAGVGIGTSFLIDFRIAPDLGLGRRQDGDQAWLEGVEVQPTFALLPPNPRAPDVIPMGIGFIGKF